ncbi:MAG: 2-C-methyl-D-erythritol 4-phosphate cytidylyltransferase [Pyrinomonadaceae bacterium]|nr:2-C-methyl-D-erythritol 4-phosphate cytidylyltransferase [Pyrinomonadaceae bacterium]
MIFAIIVAAGSGKRFGGTRPKQFIELAGKPILVHTIEKFENCAAIDEIILVLSSDEIENFSETIARFDLRKLKKIVAGGTTRAESVLNGLNSIQAANNDIIAIHDGARPLVTTEEIAQTVEKAKVTGASCLVAKVTDTIKLVENGVITGTIDRETLRRALTPQCFRYELLKRAFAKNDAGEIATDESFLVEKLGVKIATVEGSARNIKITHQDDLKIAELLLN